MSVISPESPWNWSDLLGYSADHTLRLVIELKPRIQRGATSLAGTWLRAVGEQRPDIYALFITAEFMLLRMPLVQRRPRPQLVSMPAQAQQIQLLSRLESEIDYAINASACLDAAIDTQRVPLVKLSHNGLEQVVTSWLASSIITPATELLRQPTQAWLVESGLHSLLRNGTVVPPTSLVNYALAG